jgi:phage shock protein PspC (stress-responsive transcriptional regulator)
MGSVQKVCVDCNTDVANKKRVKDAQGNYYCQSCYDARAAQKRPAAPAAMNASRGTEPAPAAAAVADPYDFPPEPQDIGDIGLAEEASPPVEAASPDMFGCADCKKLVSSSQIRNDDGEFVCQQCFAKRRSKLGTGRAAPKATSGKPGAAQFSSFGEEEEKPATFYDSALAGLLFTPGIFVATFGLLFGINIVMPTFKGTGVPLVMATAYTAMMGIIAGLLLVSLLFAKMAGAVTLDRFGGKLWKICALAGGLTLIIRFVDHLQIALSIPFIGWIMAVARYYILRGGIGVIFNIDVSAARVIAIVNTIIGFFLRIGLYVIMLIAIAAVHVANHEDMNGNPIKELPPIQQLQPLDANQDAAPAPNANNAPTDNAPAAPAAPAQ